MRHERHLGVSVVWLGWPSSESSRSFPDARSYVFGRTTAGIKRRRGYAYEQEHFHGLKITETSRQGANAHRASGDVARCRLLAGHNSKRLSLFSPNNRATTACLSCPALPLPGTTVLSSRPTSLNPALHTAALGEASSSFHLTGTAVSCSSFSPATVLLL